MLFFQHSSHMKKPNKRTWCGSPLIRNIFWQKNFWKECGNHCSVTGVTNKSNHIGHIGSHKVCPTEPWMLKLPFQKKKNYPLLPQNTGWSEEKDQVRILQAEIHMGQQLPCVLSPLCHPNPHTGHFLKNTYSQGPSAPGLSLLARWQQIKSACSPPTPMSFCITFRCTASWLENHILYRVVPAIFPVPTWSHTYLSWCYWLGFLCCYFTSPWLFRNCPFVLLSF